MVFEASLRCLTPPICKHNAGTMGLERIQMVRGSQKQGGGGGHNHLQTECSHDGFGRDSCGV